MCPQVGTPLFREVISEFKFSSNLCRLAPIGLGWEMAFGHVDRSGSIDKQGHRWIDVDERGSVIPVWEAFELF